MGSEGMDGELLDKIDDIDVDRFLDVNSFLTSFSVEFFLY